MEVAIAEIARRLVGQPDMGRELRVDGCGYAPGDGGGGIELEGAWV